VTWPTRVLAGCLAVTVFAVGCRGDDVSEQPTKRAGVSVPSSVTSLRVRGEVGKVKVTARKGASKISVVQKRTGAAKPSNVIGRSDATLKYDCPGGFDDRDCRVDYTITVPPSVSLDVVNSAGTVDLAGPLTEVVASADAGAVTGTGLGAGSFTVTTKAGKVDLAFAGVPTLVKTATDVGETTIAVPPTGSYQIDASTSVGEQDVSVPNDPSSENRIEANTEIGQITIKKN
jgi:hypothetical protein